jgi:NADH-quinone oxidoreductase subunit G
VLNHSHNATTEKADIVLPAATFAESTGTLVNYEGRAQRYYRVLPEDQTVKDSWKILSEISALAGIGDEPENYDALMNSMVEAYPSFAKIVQILPDSEFRYFSEKIARQTPRFSGRTAMDANISVSEPAPPEDSDSALKFSMEGYKGVTPSNLTPYYWSPGWNSPQAINKYLNEPGGDPMDGNPGALLFENKTGRKPDNSENEK